LIDRLIGVARKLIDKCQTTFIKGRYILDGGVILHATLREMKRKKLKGVFFQVDFEKAHDSVIWVF
jgi:hypothetical protein